MAQALALERFAELSARLDAGGKRSDVLGADGVSAEQWDSSQQFWLGKMADEAGVQRYALAQRYGALYKAAQLRLAKESAKPAPPPRRAAPAQVVVHAIPIVPPRVETPPVAPPSVVNAPMAPPSVAPPSMVPAQVPPPSVAPPSVTPRSAVPPPPVSHPSGSYAAPPSVAPPSSYAARLTVEQLAAMRAEVATAPEAEHAGVFERFGLDPATLELEEAHWQRRLAREPDLFQRYLRQFQYCRSLLQRR
jgi:hypothetical protein